jgi:hypothetical protein
MDSQIKSTAVWPGAEASESPVRVDPTDKPWGDDLYLDSKYQRHTTLYAWHPLTGIAADTVFLFRDASFAGLHAPQPIFQHWSQAKPDNPADPAAAAI